MKQIDKKDMPKLIALIVLAVGLFGYAIFSIVGAGAPPPAAAAKPAASPTPGAVAGVTDPSGDLADADGAARPVFDPSLVGFPTGGKDPFTPVAALSRDMMAAAPTPVRPVPSVPPLALAPPPPSNFEALIAPVKALTAPVNTGVVLPSPPPPPSFVVTGIVMGDTGQGDHRHVAILRGTGTGGAEERRFVVGGDPVGNGFVVARVHSYGVEIKEQFGSRRVLLKLGENAADKLRSPATQQQPAATPEAAAAPPQQAAPIQTAPQPQSAIIQNNNLGDNARATK